MPHGTYLLSLTCPVRLAGTSKNSTPGPYLHGCTASVGVSTLGKNSLLYRPLGRTSLNVSLLSLGSGGAKRLGQTEGLTQGQQTAIVRRALDLGVNLIDTSANYGESESILGKALQEVPREAYILSTKWSAETNGTLPGDPSLLTDSLEQSLRHLGTDHVEIMFFHGPLAHQLPIIIDCFYPTMERLRDEGKIQFIGLSTQYAAEPSQVVADVALKMSPELWDVIMLKYGILNQHMAKETLPLAVEHGIGIMNMAAVRVKLPDPHLLEQLIVDWKAKGYLQKDSVPEDDPLGWLVHDDVDSVVSAGYKFAAEHQAISTVITGTSNISHMEANASALENPSLPSADSLRIKTLFGDIVEYA